MANKLGLCIGINYAGKKHALNGCLNDAADWGNFLRSAGFAVATLLEGEATRSRLLTQISLHVASLQPGDTGVVTFSGHGTRVPDASGDEPDGYDECLVPYDAERGGRNLVSDDELGKIFATLVPGATLVWITDCCHSGSLFRMFDPGPGDNLVRYLPPADLFTNAELLDRLPRDGGGAAAPYVREQKNTPLPGVVHYSACMDHEYAVDSKFGGRHNGVFTHYALTAFANARAASASYEDAFNGVRSFVPSYDYPQEPQLNATPELRRAKFLG